MLSVSSGRRLSDADDDDNSVEPERSRAHKEQIVDAVCGATARKGERERAEWPSCDRTQAAALSSQVEPPQVKYLSSSELEGYGASDNMCALV